MISLRTLVKREVVRILRIWPQTLIPPVITMTLYFLIFGNLIGARIGSMMGVGYIDFIVPGLVMMSVITNSYANVVASFFSSKFQRNIEELLISPMTETEIITGFVSGGIIRGILVGFLVTGISLFFTRLRMHNPGVVFFTLLLTTVLFSLGGLLNAIFAKKFDDINIFPTFVLTPLTYLGGVFYSIQSLPEFWQKVSLGNPIVYMVSAFRYGFLGIEDMNLYLALGILIVLNILLFLICFRLLRTGHGMRN